MNSLVSIVMPTYNSEKTIVDSINSVINQTYKNWELLVVDDISTDKTVDIVKSFALKDSRIKLYILNIKGGASIARNVAIDKSKGRYISFLDSDDMWLPEKLSSQIKFMEENNYVLTYSNYISKSKVGEKIIKSPKSINYIRMCISNPIGCLTVIYDCYAVGKIQIPKIEKRNDYALWLIILKKGYKGFLFDEVLGIYRDHNGVSSGSGLSKVKYHFKLFNKVLNYNILFSTVLTLINVCGMLFQIINRKRLF